jgi:pSer/pThr/pTyr-binding forkhead associated (FHA) protein
MYLYILNGIKEGLRIALTPGIYSIGRSADSKIAIPDDQYVSSAHAELHFDSTGILTLRDIGSRNGTFLLGETVSDPKQVKPGDIFQIGRTFFKFSRRSSERFILQEEEGKQGNPEAILVIDIVGSSHIAQAMGDRVADKVKNVLLDKLNVKLQRNPAEFVKSTGDGYLIIFPNVRAAIKLAMDLLLDMREEESSKGIHIRMGIHFGETIILPDGDRRGLAVDMAFRVESVKIHEMHQTASGIKKDMLPRIDRIFITEVVQKMIASDSKIKSRCIGYFDLKGFTGRHKIFEIFV